MTLLAAEQVVQAVAQRMRGLPLGAEVNTDRAWPLNVKALPAWQVFAGDEEVRPLTLSQNPTMQYQMPVECRGYVLATEQLDTQMNALAAEALAAVADLAPATADALADLRHLVTLRHSYTGREMQTEGQATVGRITLIFTAQFRTRMSAPTTIV